MRLTKMELLKPRAMKKRITKKNAEKIAHNIHKKMDFALSIFKYNNGNIYETIQRKAGDIIYIVAMSTKHDDFLTASMLETLQGVVKPYISRYDGIRYYINTFKERDNEVCFRLCIDIMEY